MRTHTAFEDSGHGWLQVLKSELPADIYISPYSYQDAQYVYLEEDCDGPTYMNAVGLTGADIVSQYVNGQSHIRNMRSFSQGKRPLPAAPAMRPAQELREELQGRIEDTAAGHDRRCALHDNHPAVRVQRALPF